MDDLKAFRWRKFERLTICALLSLVDGAAWRGGAPKPCMTAFMCLTVRLHWRSEGLVPPNRSLVLQERRCSGRTLQMSAANAH